MMRPGEQLRWRGTHALGLLAVSLSGVIGLVPDWRRVALIAGHPSASVARLGSDAVCAALAGLVLWAILVGLSLGLAASAIAAVPSAGSGVIHVIATAAQRIALLLLPRVLVRLVAGAAGVAVVLAPVAAQAAPVTAAQSISRSMNAATVLSPSTSPAPSSAPSTAIPAPAWPSDPTPEPTRTPAAAPSSRPATAAPASATALPAPGYPTDAPAITPKPSPIASATPTSNPLPSPSPVAITPIPTPALPTSTTPTPGPGTSSGTTGTNAPTAPAQPTSGAATSGGATSGNPATGAAQPITVRPGDSLWLITAQRLGPAASPAQIAAAWPSWYAANRDHIGPDPALIRPGEVLVAPIQPTQPSR